MALRSNQLALADAALEAAKQGRAFYEVWKPSIEEITAMRGWLSDPRVGNATLNVYLEKCRDAAGPAAWDAVVAKWASEINAARTAYADATERVNIPEEFLDAAKKAAGFTKWIVIGAVAFAVIVVAKEAGSLRSMVKVR